MASHSAPVLGGSGTGAHSDRPATSIGWLRRGRRFASLVLRERFGARLWVLPGAAALTALCAEKVLVRVDHAIERETKAWFLFGGQADSARELLSTIASSMMTFTGLVFSITILALQLASSQFSPRVLRTFLKDRVTQVAMAIFVGTFVFAMALLPDVRSAAEARDEFVPALSVFVAFALVLVSVGVFIHYIDHMAQGVRAVTVIKRVAEETRRSLREQYPDVAAEAEEPSTVALPDSARHVIPHDGPAGVLSAVNEEALLLLAREGDAIVHLLHSPGDFVPARAPLFEVYGSRDCIAADKLQAAVSIVDERSPQQDPAFGFRQLVDVAERALSPGVNDPSTAVQALDEIHDLLRILAPRRFPSAARLEDDGRLRLVLPSPSWEDYVHLALDEIYEYGRSSSQVVRRMRALLVDCITVAPPRRRVVLEDLLDQLGKH